MAKDPAFLFYTQDFYTGTRLMTPEERACYIDLLIYQHQYEFIPNDLDRTLLFCTGVAKATLEATLEAKFERGDKGWFNERLKNVILGRQEFKEKTSQSGKIGQLHKKIKALLPSKESTKIRRYLNDMGKDFVLSELLNLNLKDEESLKGWLEGLLKHLENENENYKIFYEKELKKTKDENYHKLVDFLYGNNPTGKKLNNVLKIPEQLTYEGFQMLYNKSKERGKKLSSEILSLQNYSPKRPYTSLQLTLSKWLDSD